MKKTSLVVLSMLLSVQAIAGMRLPGAPSSLAERLGFKATDKLLIINVDDVGNSHAANAAVIDSMENGLATSSTMIVPGPWFPEIAAYAKAHPNSDFGVHLAHTSEWKTLKWGPIANKSDVPGLVDPQGYLWPDIAAVYKNSNPEQAYVEARAQIKKALDAGIDVTHIDSHMGTLQYNEAYFQVYRRLAKEFNLPIRMGSQELLAAQGGGHQRGQLDSDGTVYPDYLIHGDRKPNEPIRDYWKRSVSSLKPGVTELYIHASVPGDEIKNITNSWQDRAAEYELFTRDPEIRRILESQGVKRIGYRALRDLQRKSRSEPTSVKPSNLDAQNTDDPVHLEVIAYENWFRAKIIGDYSTAIQLAREYLNRFPNGKYAAYLKFKWLPVVENVSLPEKPHSTRSMPAEATHSNNLPRQQIDYPNPIDFFEESTKGTAVFASLAEDLIAAGDDVNIKFKDGKTALMLEAAIGNLERVKALIQSGADVNAIEDVHGWSALTIAVWRGNPAVVQFLLDHGANLRLEDKQHRTALRHAELAGWTDISKQLIGAR